MAISGQANINIGAENESVGSDSLFTAFNKIQNNFSKLFTVASPAVAANANSGVNVTSSGNTVYITNTGVTAITAGTNIIISSSNGNVEISSTGSNGNGSGGTVTSVGLTAATGISIGGTNPVTSNGNISVGLAAISPSPAGAYAYPTVTVDQYGRITSIANGASVGTVTSVGLNAVGDGLVIANSPVTTSGTISIQNTGVTRLNAGTGIALSGSTGNITITNTNSGGTGTVTSVGLTSTTLTVSPTPITTNGNLSVEIPANVAVTGRFLLSGSEDLAASGAANLLLTASYFTTTTAETATLAAGTAGQIKTFMMVGDGGNMVITATNPGWGGSGTMTFSNVGDACTMQYIASKWFCIGNNGVVFA